MKPKLKTTTNTFLSGIPDCKSDPRVHGSVAVAARSTEEGREEERCRWEQPAREHPAQASAADRSAA